MSGFVPPGDCPNCGAPVGAHARACAECGSDARTGWSEETAVDGLDLPGELPDYDGIVEREFGVAPRLGARAWARVALAVVLALTVAGFWWLR